MFDSTALADPGASKQAIQYHYDVGNDFYHLWLDDTKTYTCALWEGAQTLQQAQEQKLDYHISQAGASGTRFALDIGCGWGPALTRMVDHHRVHHAIGLTLSQQQADYISSLGDNRIEVEVQSWFDHIPAQPYDAIVSIGAFEHFARPDMSHSQKVAGYRSFFDRCHAWLRPGKRMSLQTIAYENSDRHDLHPFIAKEIWPETDLPRLADIVVAAERKFEIIRLRNDRADYVRTCNAWIHRLNERQDEIIGLVGADVFHRYVHWFKLSMIGFHTGTMSLLRITFQRVP
ncbi:MULTISPECIES: class I SAM-dependent methyltransferase [unclassified Mesorhizobium]|uniref:class I SAM-dependent methyltransferase n=1 Tax=unclassified Mesorhizobium TaxID=325217 RepID=UPI003337CB9D